MCRKQTITEIASHPLWESFDLSVFKWCGKFPIDSLSTLKHKQKSTIKWRFNLFIFVSIWTDESITLLKTRKPLLLKQNYGNRPAFTHQSLRKATGATFRTVATFFLNLNCPLKCWENVTNRRYLHPSFNVGVGCQSSRTCWFQSSGVKRSPVVSNFYSTSRKWCWPCCFHSVCDDSIWHSQSHQSAQWKH